MILSAIRKKYGTREAFGFLRKTTGSHYPNLRFWVQCKPTRQFFFFLFRLSFKSSQHSRYIILHLYVPHKLEERCRNTFWTDVFFGVTVVNRSKGSLKNVNNLMPHMKLIFFMWKKNEPIKCNSFASEINWKVYLHIYGIISEYLPWKLDTWEMAVLSIFG